MYTDCKSVYAGSIPTPASKNSSIYGRRENFRRMVCHPTTQTSPRNILIA
jgi:hypothetical protein